jgi:LPXTG-motif cell wall-anchored protein
VDWYLLVGVALGVVLAGVYALKRRRDAKLENAVLLFLSAVAIPVGFHLVYVSVTHEIKPFNAGERVYIALGGLALIWVSSQTIISAIWPSEPPTAS